LSDHRDTSQALGTNDSNHRPPPVIHLEIQRPGWLVLSLRIIAVTLLLLRHIGPETDCTQ